LVGLKDPTLPDRGTFQDRGLELAHVIVHGSNAL